MEGKDGRTEPATGKKRSEEREKGNLCISQEVVNLSVLLLGLIGLRLTLPNLYQSSVTMMQSTFRFEDMQTWTGVKVQSLFIQGSLLVGWIMFPLLIGVVVGTVGGNMLQTKPFFSWGAFRMNPNALNPISGIRKLISFQALFGLGLSCLKVAVIVFIAYKIIAAKLSMLELMPSLSSAESIQWTGDLIFRLVVWVLSVFLIVAILDWIFRHRQFEKSIMMTKQEVKDEMKQQEVSPVVKRAMSKRMRELSLHRMMAAVPNANVIITNPTHVAVALQYDPAKMNSPKVVAKGMRLVAQRIKKLGARYHVPIVEKPELARALYKSVKVGQEIPSRFFEAVATVLAYLHKIGRGIRMTEGGRS